MLITPLRPSGYGGQAGLWLLITDHLLLITRYWLTNRTVFVSLDTLLQKVLKHFFRKKIGIYTISKIVLG